MQAKTKHKKMLLMFFPPEFIRFPRFDVVLASTVVYESSTIRTGIFLRGVSDRGLVVVSFFAGPVETPPDNALYDQMIGRRGRADSHAKVELPLWTEVHINRGDKLLLLLA